MKLRTRPETPRHGQRLIIKIILDTIQHYCIIMVSKTHIAITLAGSERTLWVIAPPIPELMWTKLGM